MDFDPRDYDSRDDERSPSEPSTARRSGSDDRERENDWSQPGVRTRDRDDDGAPTLGRGPGNARQESDEHGWDGGHDPRWADRDRDNLERDHDARDTFTRHVRLPRGWYP
jgi:hypothetical protein